MTIHSSTSIDLLFAMIIPFVILFRQVKSNYFTILRAIVNSSQLNIELEMIRLNERKQFTKTLDLFDKHHDPDALTDRIIVQALKACSQLGSFERGHNIHKQLSNQSKNNRFIQASLIHFYSKFALLVWIHVVAVEILQCNVAE